MAVLGLAAVVLLLTRSLPDADTRVALIALAAAAVITLGATIIGADSATRQVHRAQAVSPVPALVPDQTDVQRRLGEIGFLIARGRQELHEVVERARAGQDTPPRSVDYSIADTGDPFMRLARELQKAQAEAWNAVADAASRKAAPGPHQRVEVFVNLARRMQSLAHRAIQGLDELENQVEDPDLLKGLFKVDHLSTRMRRQAESLAVIGGAASRRQWSRPVTVYEVLRSAIAEVEHYNRVKVVPSVEGTLDGRAVADVIHLLAELIENATKFAPPHTQVLVRVDSVAAGLVIEVEDRGLGTPRESQRRLNDLLSAPERIDTDELLRDGRIGLLVVSALARRHNVRVKLETNLYGGTQAIVVIPRDLIGTESEADDARAQAQPVPSDAVPAMSASGPMPAALPTPEPSSGSGARTGAGPLPLGGAPDVPDQHPTGPIATTWGGQGPGASARQPYPGPAAPDRGRQPAPSAPSASGAAPEHRGGADADKRPPLPKRSAQANLASELRDVASPQNDDEAEIEHNLGLMAAFQRGIRSGSADGGPGDGADTSG